MVNWNVSGSVDVSFFSPLQPATATTATSIRYVSLRMNRNMSQSQILRKRHSHRLFESLRERLDGAGRLVEEDALHAKERYEHGDQIEVRILVVRHLAHPVVERVEVDAAQRDAGRGKRGQDAEELLLRVHQV